MIIKLTKTTLIPDEQWDPEAEHNVGKVRPGATNYAGAELEVSEELGERLIEEGHAVALGEPAQEAEDRN